jgi:hypothetical protein
VVFVPINTTVEPARQSVWPRDSIATWCGSVAAGLGAWLLASPFILDHGRAARWNDIFVAAFLLTFGAMLGLLGVRSAELSGLLAVLGAWLIVSPVVLPYGSFAAWSDRSVGVAVLLLAIAASPVAWRPRRRRSPGTRRPE